MKPSEPKKLTADLSPFGAWAFALGTSVCWGSLVVTSNAYLVKAGPAGSVLGMIAGTRQRITDRPAGSEYERDFYRHP